MFTSDFSVGDLEQGLKPLFLLWHGAMDGTNYPSLSKLGLPNTEFTPDILSIYEIERDACRQVSDFKALYARSKDCKTLRNKFVGTRLSQHEGFGPESMVWTAFAELAADPRPLLVTLPYVGPLSDYQSTAEIYLPLQGERVDVQYILVGVELLERAFSPEISNPH
ncbi:hypothetical protein RSK20926_11069 [Roseobacter sp. SK209-2-6]|uniref:hypothetical protein n=1 Tax=Roseobacter sp. SK209-2-6 TaxID=388739 RepID=UPI0000F3C782|nr:hypothetical protein [Roseobacter sp. SK209-2-6]EBA18255.1 hypothetical protein RSK20926_11069 [Roseobacter sp. SK209-2-6]